jgi:hypothetical protein
MPMLVHPWVLLPEVRWLLPLLALVEARRQTGRPANCWVVLACSRLRRVCSSSLLLPFMPPIAIILSRSN